MPIGHVDTLFGEGPLIAFVNFSIECFIYFFSVYEFIRTINTLTVTYVIKNPMWENLAFDFVLFFCHIWCFFKKKLTFYLFLREWKWGRGSERGI